MKKTIISVYFFLFMQTAFGQNILALQDSIAIYFNEIKDATQKAQTLWDKDLYGPILLVNPDTRQLYSNVPDSAGILKLDAEIYSGILPNNINIANTSIHWNGIHWAMIMLPLPKNKQDRICLLAHELFHSAQQSLGFESFNKENNHLDRKDGRVYLRLELEALKKAIQSSTISEMKNHLTNAFIFRKYRNLLYPGSDSTENLLELNEGIAEYTGMTISARDREQAILHFEQSINGFLSNPSFVRSFAYQTIPVYGYLLYSTKKDWNRNITIKINLTDYFIKSFNVILPGDIQKNIKAILNQYNGKVIVAEETEREEKTNQLIAEYKRIFIEQPHFEIHFIKMNISFDTKNLIPIEDKGTIYPNIRVVDSWGILNVEKGALMSPNWDKISVTNPTTIENNIVTGDGWTLELNDGYTVIKDENNENYKLKKK